MKRLFMLAMVVLFVVFGLTAYRQNENAKIYREEKNKMHQELMKQRQELQAARLEVAKLQQMLEMERKNAQAMVNQVRNKK